MFKIKGGNCPFRNTRKLLQQNKKPSIFGVWSIAYLGAKLWNDNVCNFSDIREIEFSTLKTCMDDPYMLLVDVSDFLANYVSLMHIVGILFSEYKFSSLAS